MNKLLSLYGRTVSLIAIVFIISFAVLGLAFSSISSMKERDRVRELERSILLANSQIQEFIITRDPTFAKNTQFILRQADEILQDGIRTDNYDKLHTELHLYLLKTEDLISAFQARGFYEEDGLEGEIRSRLLRVENELRELGIEAASIALLEARKNEKDYFLIRKSHYRDGVHESIDQVLTRLDASGIEDNQLDDLKADLAGYQHDFDEIVLLIERVDWIKGELQLLREGIGETLEYVIQEEQRRAQTYLWIALGLILLSFVVGILFAMYIARSVVKPLGELKSALSRMADGKTVDTLETDDTSEFHTIVSSLNEVAEQIRLRQEAESKMKESKDSAERYAIELEQAKSALEERAQELDLAVEELENAKGEAEISARIKADFLANMSHEIRTPLNGIIGMTSLLSTEDLRNDQREVVEVIRTSGESLLSIVNDILDFSKIEAGGVQLEKEPFTPISLAEDALSVVSRQASEKSVDLSYMIDEDVPYRVLGDNSRMRQILVNLLGNAVKFTEAGEIQIRIQRLRDEETGDEVFLQFSVEDTGIGIPKEKLEGLFEPFRQAEVSTARKFGGTGLGLTISRHLSELMGGRMWAESTVGAGSTFHFVIRTAKAEPGEDHLDRFEDGVRRSVLLLDDQSMFSASFSWMLRSMNLFVEIAKDEEEALELVQDESEYHAVFVNDVSGGFDGVAAMAVSGMLRNAAPETPVVVLKHIHELAGDVRQCLRKPVRYSTLWSMVRSMTPDPQSHPESGGDGASDISMNGHAVRPSPNGLHPGRNGDRPAIPASGPSRHVLLVEDNIINQKVAKRMLENLGCRVDAVEGGQAAIDALLSVKYSTVFMDVQMPGMDGLEATRRIRQMGEKIEQPYIIALTANATTQDRTRCLDAGMDEYTSKPISSKTLERVLSQIPARFSGPAFSSARETTE